MGRPPRPALERFARQTIILATGCIEWTGTIDRDGYGQFLPAGGRQARKTSAHRWSYQHFIGPIRDGLQVDHLCRNRACVNPSHLEAVTPRENVMRSPLAPGAINSRKTHCPKGHPYFGDNLYVFRRNRICKRCKAAYDAIRHSRKKAS